MIDTPRDAEQTDSQLEAEEEEFSNEHPLASPNELAGSADAGIKLEFAAREIADAENADLPLTADAQGAELPLAADAQGAELPLAADAQGAASGIDYEEDTLPLEGE
jgi:hypothetical protein